MFKIDSKNVKLNKEEFLETIRDMMNKGIKIHDLDKMYEDTIEKFNAKKDEISSKYNIENPSSPKQLQYYLQSLHRAEVMSACTINRKFTTGAEALRKLSILGYEFGDDMIEFRNLDSIRKAIKQLVENVDSENYIRPTATLGRTNRVQYSKPALLSLPKDMLWDLIAPREDGQKIWSVDIKNQEPNIIANIKNCQEIKDRLGGSLYEKMFEWCYGPKAKLTVVVFNCNEISVINNEDIAKMTSNEELYAPYRINEQFKYDGYSVKAAYPKCISCPIGTKLTEDKLPKTVKIYADMIGCVEAHVKWNLEHRDEERLGVFSIDGEITDIALELDSNVRKEFKTSWNALTYGQTKAGLVSMCKNIDANVLWDKFNSIDGLKNWRNNCNKIARQGGNVVVHSYFGEAMYPDGYNSSAIARQIMDYEVQGTGADILELLVRNFNKKNSSDIEIYYTRHDELILLAGKETNDEEVGKILKELFEHQVDDWRPFEVEIRRVV